MKGLSLPIEVLIVIVVAIIILILLILLAIYGFLPGVKGMVHESRGVANATNTTNTVVP